MKKNLASMNQRWPGSPENIVERDHPFAAPLHAQTAEDKKRILNSGGAGCFAKPNEYVSE